MVSTYTLGTPVSVSSLLAEILYQENHDGITSSGIFMQKLSPDL